MNLSPLLLRNSLIIKNKHKKNHQELLFYRSTICIEFIIDSYKKKYKREKINLALPYYYCKSTIEYIQLKHKNINFVFYDITTNEDINLSNFVFPYF